MEEFVIFLVIAAIGFIRWLYDKTREKPPEEEADTFEAPRPVAQPPARRRETEEERVRRFMEALGVPAGEKPPEPVQPRAVPPPIRSAPPPIPPPRVEERRGFVAREQPASTIGDMLREAEATAQRGEEEARRILAGAPVHKGGRPAREIGVVRSGGPDIHGAGVRALLRSRDSLKTAIVLREVLGLPRALDRQGDIPAFR